MKNDLIHAEKPYRIVNLGFQAPRITADHYVLGGGMVPYEIIRPDGQWLASLPPAAPQFNGTFDTFGCTVFGTLNAIEIILTALSLYDGNMSDRFTYITSGTKPPGNDPHTVAETIREAGLIKESELPFSPDINSLLAFTSFGGDPAPFLAEGEAWTATFEFLHEWIISTNIPLLSKQQILVDHLKHSPIGVSVRAWQQRPNGLYFKEQGESDTHWTVIIGYVLGVKWFALDSYPGSGGSFIKELEWDYDFGFAKRYHLAKRPLGYVAPKKSWIASFIKWLLNLIKI